MSFETDSDSSIASSSDEQALRQLCVEKGNLLTLDDESLWNLPDVVIATRLSKCDDPNDVIRIYGRLLYSAKRSKSIQKQLSRAIERLIKRSQLAAAKETSPP